MNNQRFSITLHIHGEETNRYRINSFGTIGINHPQRLKSSETMTNDSVTGPTLLGFMDGSFDQSGRLTSRDLKVGTAKEPECVGSTRKLPHSA